MDIDEGRMPRRTNRNLCDCIGTARRAMLVISCYISRGTGVGKVSNSKSDLGDHTYIQTNLYSAKIVETNQRRWRRVTRQ